MTAPLYSAADYQAALLALLPRGRVWPRDPGSTVSAVADGLSRVYARNNADGNALLVDAFPITAVNLLPEWEATLGLPDPCLGPAPTLEQRQASVKARLLTAGGDSIAYYKAYALALGFVIDIQQYAPFRVGFNGMGDPIGDEDWFFVWQIRADTTDTAALACELRAITPAHTVLTFASPDLFDSLEQLPITPSDTALLSPIPFGGLYFPTGGTVALEGATGVVTPHYFLPGTWFYGLIPKRVRFTGSDPGLVVYGLYSPALTSLLAYSGDRQIFIVPSDTVSLSVLPVGGLYLVESGALSYADVLGGTGSVIATADTWFHGELVGRVNDAGTTVDTIIGFTQ